ncbi:MAG: hypothetical protein M3Y53_04800, partial [Thermoproteota archaeon]|nr:hypothetical protein [Thermoproteota archaeon]
MTDEYTDFTQHKFGVGTLRELATKLYRNPIAAYREAVSNALDAMIPYESEEKPRVEIYTNIVPDGDIIIEDWGTGIENYEGFTTISQGEKVVRDQVSSYEKINEKIIGHKGMGKLSFLALSSECRVEFYSNSEKVGMHILMTDDMGPAGFSTRYMNSQLALPHHGLKVVIKNAKKPVVSDTRLIEYLSQIFAIRIARGAKVLVNGQQVCKPVNFDSNQYPLFELDGGTQISGNLKHVEKPKINNIVVFVKKVRVVEKDFGYKVEGWINCDQLELESSRDGILEGNDIYSDFLKKLSRHLDDNFEKKSEIKEIAPRSKKQIAKLFVDVMKTINHLYPEMIKPIITGLLSNEREGMGSRSDLGEMEGHCTLHEGTIDPDGEIITGKPIGLSKGHRRGPGESTCTIRVGPKKEILAPS